MNYSSLKRIFGYLGNGHLLTKKAGTAYATPAPKHIKLNYKL